MWAASLQPTSQSFVNLQPRHCTEIPGRREGWIREYLWALQWEEGELLSRFRVQKFGHCIPMNDFHSRCGSYVAPIKFISIITQAVWSLFTWLFISTWHKCMSKCLVWVFFPVHVWCSWLNNLPSRTRDLQPRPLTNRAFYSYAKPVEMPIKWYHEFKENMPSLVRAKRAHLWNFFGLHHA